MPDTDPIIAVFAGAFDPITHGHLDIINRASCLFDRLIVAVGCNPEKAAWFSSAERVEMIREAVAHLPNVETASYLGLTMDYARQIGARVLVRGIRDTVDLREEVKMAKLNQLVGAVETVFLLTDDRHAMTSSTLIKQILDLGGRDEQRLAQLVPPVVIRHLRNKMN